MYKGESRREKRKILLFWEIVIRVFPLLVVSSGNRRKQCQQPCPTHQLLKPFVPRISRSFISCRFFFLIDIYICGLRHLRYSLPHFEGLPATTLYSRIFRPTNNIRLYFLTAIPWYLKVRCYEQPRALYFCACLPVRFLIRNSFSCFLIYAATMRDLWEFYLPRCETRNTWYVCAYEWVGFGVYFPGAICDRPRENCGRELRWKWEGWEKKDSESRTKIREIRIRLVNHNSFESQSCSSVDSLITWPRRKMKLILRFTLAKGILHSWNPILYVHTCMRNLRRTLEISHKSRRVERLSVSFRGFP